MEAMTTTITYLGITATEQEWRAVHLRPLADGSGLDPFERCSPDITSELMAARAALPPDAPGWRVLGEFARAHAASSEAKSAASAQYKTAEAINELARVLGAESAEALARRMPERLRPYVEAVLRQHS